MDDSVDTSYYQKISPKRKQKSSKSYSIPLKSSSPQNAVQYRRTPSNKKLINNDKKLVNYDSSFNKSHDLSQEIISMLGDTVNKAQNIGSRVSSPLATPRLNPSTRLKMAFEPRHQERPLEYKKKGNPDTASNGEKNDYNDDNKFGRIKSLKRKIVSNSDIEEDDDIGEVVKFGKTSSGIKSNNNNSKFVSKSKFPRDVESDSESIFEEMTKTSANISKNLEWSLRTWKYFIRFVKENKNSELIMKEFQIENDLELFLRLEVLKKMLKKKQKKKSHKRRKVDNSNGHGKKK